MKAEDRFGVWFCVVGFGGFFFGGGGGRSTFLISYVLLTSNEEVKANSDCNIVFRENSEVFIF